MSMSVTAVCTAICKELALVGQTGIKLYDLVIKTYLTCFLIHLDIVALVEEQISHYKEVPLMNVQLYHQCQVRKNTSKLVRDGLEINGNERYCFVLGF